MDITKFIPYGREHAVSRKYLVERTGMDDRQVRKLIEDARRQVPIINLQDGEGYFRPLPEDREYVVRWLSLTRAQSLGNIRKHARRRSLAEENASSADEVGGVRNGANICQSLC